MSDHAPQARRARRPVRRQRPARADRRRLLRAGQGAAGACRGGGRVRGRRGVRRPVGLRRATSSARGCSTPTRTRSGSCRRGTASACWRSASTAAPGSRCPVRSPRTRSTASTRRWSGATGFRACARAAQVLNARTTNWTRDAVPDRPPGRELVHPDLEPDAALERLWEEIAHVCRLDEPDPVAAWQQRLAGLTEVGRQAQRAATSTPLRYEGPGTSLTIGLLPEQPLAVRPARDRRRDRARAEPAHRGGVRHARSRARGRAPFARPSRCSSAAR